MKEEFDLNRVKIATARCARVSYTVVGDDKRSSAEWQKLYPEIKVLDPDGWDRSDFDRSWNELITLEEYNNRVMRSTCSGDLKPFTLKPKDNYQKDIKLHDKLALDRHWSPFEHCARAMSEKETILYSISSPKQKGLDMSKIQLPTFVPDERGWSGNFRGFIQYRKMFDNENIK